MTNQERTIVLAAASFVALAIVKSIKTTRNERRKRTVIDTETQRQKQAMQVAVKRVQDKIRNGGYGDKVNMKRAFEDFEFETIAERFKD